MANKKKSVYKCKPLTDGKREIIQKLLQEYDIQDADSLQEALRDLLGGTIKSMMEAEMDDYLGYDKSQRSDSDNARNGHKVKRVRSNLGEIEIEVPVHQGDVGPPDFGHALGHLRLQGLGRLHLRRDGQALAANRGMAK